VLRKCVPKRSFGHPKSSFGRRRSCGVGHKIAKTFNHELYPWSRVSTRVLDAASKRLSKLNVSVDMETFLKRSKHSDILSNKSHLKDEKCERSTVTISWNLHALTMAPGSDLKPRQSTRRALVTSKQGRLSYVTFCYV
jgi:hypothetical protein